MPYAGEGRGVVVRAEGMRERAPELCNCNRARGASKQLVQQAYVVGRPQEQGHYDRKDGAAPYRACTWKIAPARGQSHDQAGENADDLQTFDKHVAYCVSNSTPTGGPIGAHYRTPKFRPLVEYHGLRFCFG